MSTGAAATCVGYVKKGPFSNRCRYCNEPNSSHPPAKFKMVEKRPPVDVEQLKKNREYYRWCNELMKLMTEDLLPALEHMRRAMM